MSLTKPIPKKLREEMANDTFYEKCCITGLSKNAVKIEWHHNLVSYVDGNKGRVNEKFCILPIADFVHHNVNKYKEKLDWIMWNRASKSDIIKYSKATNYQRELERLNTIYGDYSKRKPAIN